MVGHLCICVYVWSLLAIGRVLRIEVREQIQGGKFRVSYVSKFGKGAVGERPQLILVRLQTAPHLK